MACGDNVVPTVPVNTGRRTAVSELAAARRRARATAPERGSTDPTSYALRWQRATAVRLVQHRRCERDSSYVSTQRRRRGGPAGGRHRDQRGRRRRSSPRPRPRRSRARRPRSSAAPTVPAPTSHPKLRIALRDHARHSKGTLAATVVSVWAGREVRTKSAKVVVTAGTWRLRLCAGPKSGTPAVRADQARAHAHARRAPPRCACARALREGRAAGDRRARRRPSAHPRAGLGRRA